ncbi:MAG: sigma 54-interacting transcriptional regulator [Nitrososphaeraceae archaeon]|jgi:DNA polymerase III delta prime subunit
MRASEGAINSRKHSSEQNDVVSLSNEGGEPFDGDTISQFQVGSQLFSNIVGYEDIKKLFQLSLYSRERPVHILLVGPPASAKTLFMLECMKLERSYFTLGSHSTKSGMIEYLFEKRPRYLIIDEIEHMPLKDQTALLSLMETGIIAETKFQKARNTQLKTWVFATSNATERMLTPLLSRFLVLYFKPYKYGNFKEVTIHLLCHGEGIAEDIAAEVADVVWTKLKSRDIRDCVKIANLAKTKEDVKWVVETMRNYSRKPKEK